MGVNGRQLFVRVDCNKFGKSENVCCSCKNISDIIRFMADHAISAK